ncbi:hypothetical protein HHI36_008758, partial [Cryptolaemus montrouzieri]
ARQTVWNRQDTEIISKGVTHNIRCVILEDCRFKASDYMIPESNFNRPLQTVIPSRVRHTEEALQIEI